MNPRIPWFLGLSSLLITGVFATATPVPHRLVLCAALLTDVNFEDLGHTLALGERFPTFEAPVVVNGNALNGTDPVGAILHLSREKGYRPNLLEFHRDFVGEETIRAYLLSVSLRARELQARVSERAHGRKRPATTEATEVVGFFNWLSEHPVQDDVEGPVLAWTASQDLAKLLITPAHSDAPLVARDLYEDLLVDRLASHLSGPATAFEDERSVFVEIRAFTDRRSGKPHLNVNVSIVHPLSNVRPPRRGGKSDDGRKVPIWGALLPAGT